MSTSPQDNNDHVDTLDGTELDNTDLDTTDLDNTVLDNTNPDESELDIDEQNEGQDFLDARTTFSDATDADAEGEEDDHEQPDDQEMIDFFNLEHVVEDGATLDSVASYFPYATDLQQLRRLVEQFAERELFPDPDNNSTEIVYRRRPTIAEIENDVREALDTPGTGFAFNHLLTYLYPHGVVGADDFQDVMDRFTRRDLTTGRFIFMNQQNLFNEMRSYFLAATQGEHRDGLEEEFPDLVWSEQVFNDVLRNVAYLNSTNGLWYSRYYKMCSHPIERGCSCPTRWLSDAECQNNTAREMASKRRMQRADSTSPPSSDSSSRAPQNAVPRPLAPQDSNMSRSRNRLLAQATYNAALIADQTAEAQASGSQTPFFQAAPVQNTAAQGSAATQSPAATQGSAAVQDSAAGTSEGQSDNANISFESGTTEADEDVNISFQSGTTEADDDDQGDLGLRNPAFYGELPGASAQQGDGANISFESGTTEADDEDREGENGNQDGRVSFESGTTEADDEEPEGEGGENENGNENEDEDSDRTVTDNEEDTPELGPRNPGFYGKLPANPLGDPSASGTNKRKRGDADSSEDSDESDDSEQPPRKKLTLKLRGLRAAFAAPAESPSSSGSESESESGSEKGQEKQSESSPSPEPEPPSDSSEPEDSDEDEPEAPDARGCMRCTGVTLKGLRCKLKKRMPLGHAYNCGKHRPRS